MRRIRWATPQPENRRCRQSTSRRIRWGRRRTIKPSKEVNFSKPVVAHFDEAAFGLQQWLKGIQGATRRQMRSEKLAGLRRSLGDRRTASLLATTVGDEILEAKKCNSKFYIGPPSPMYLPE